MFIRLCLYLLLIGGSASVAAHEVSLDTSAARAVLEAIADTELDENQAQAVALLAPNQMVIRKQRSVSGSDSVTTERYVEELLAAAHGVPIDGRGQFSFVRLAERREAVLATLDQIDANLPEFLSWVETRVAMFSPQTTLVHLEGFLVAGGGSSGFTFGGEDFYTNIAHFPDDAESVRIFMAHELYHSVHRVAYREFGIDVAAIFFDPDRYSDFTDLNLRRRYVVRTFLGNLLGEGIPMYAGDPALATGDGRYAVWDRERLETQLARLDRLAIHLDMSLIALTSDPAIGYDDAYAFGFYGPDQPLYYLGYVMAKTIAEEEGPSRLGELALGNGCDFVKAYQLIAASDLERPQLGPHTVRYIDEYCS